MIETLKAFGQLWGLAKVADSQTIAIIKEIQKRVKKDLK
jgi:hypothetical protein